MSASSKKAMVSAFVDELEKLSSKKIKKRRDYDGEESWQYEKSSSVIQNLGNKVITHTGKWIARRGAELKSLPGRMGGALAAHGTPVESMKKGLRYSLDHKTGGGMVGRGLFLAGTAASAAQAIPKNDPMGQGDSRLTRAMRFAGGTASGLMAAPFGIAPSIAFGVGGDIVGGKVGRMIDRARGYKPQAPAMAPNTPALVQPERAP